MNQFRVTPAAQADLFSIWTFIARSNLEAADKLEAEIRAIFPRLAAKPDLGHFRRDLTKREVKFYAVRSYCLIIYDPETSPLEILRVIHGARDSKSELRKHLGSA